MIDRKYADFSWEQTASLLAVDSPTGYTDKAAAWVKAAFESLGFSAHITAKGGVLADLGGEDDTDAERGRKHHRREKVENALCYECCIVTLKTCIERA